MRKFNLKGKVVQRMLGIQPDENKQAGNEPDAPSAYEVPDNLFSEEQGKLCAAWRTDVGRIRKNNQDSVILGNGLAGVADGMGGHQGGEIASSGLRDGLLREIEDRQPDRDTLEEAIRTVNLELWEQQEADASLSGMGTTLTVLWPSEKDMIIAQIGDSRAYLIRNGKMEQVTSDHSMVADMVRKGVLTEEQAACHPMRNYITRAVGTEEDIEADLYILPRKKGDRWLVCSDGLHGQIPKAALQELASADDLEEAAEQLLQAALDNGGKDNISFVLLQDETDFPEEEPAETGSMDSPDESAAGEGDGQ